MEGSIATARSLLLTAGVQVDPPLVLLMSQRLVPAITVEGDDAALIASE
ncbi:MAG TPA: hypothetical protein VF962_04855 [Gemmatimonadaceae bacterium]